MGVLLQLKVPHRAVLAIALVGAVVASLVWLCARDPRITFLVRDGRAEWILFPSATNGRFHTIAELDAVFRREFVVEGQPRTARLSVRAARRVQLKINDRLVEMGTSRNWKDISNADVLACLHAGTNTVEARVFNDNAPPALWLVLTADRFTLRSDQMWETSFAGSAWRRAVLATAPRMPGRGNLIAGGEGTLSALALVWPVWMIFGGLSIAVWMAGRWWLNRIRMPKCNAIHRWLCNETVVPLLIIAVLWVALFCNNSRFIPYAVGFDARSHSNYIGYLQEHKALPLPSEGFEMLQPPLYYGISAITLSTLGLSVSDGAGVMVLRLLTMSFGLMHVVLIFLSLRLLFPGQIGRQMVGLVLAAFLPMNLYLSHYVTNETLAALLVSVSIYLCLRMLKTGTNSWASISALGFVIGAAALTKFTAVLVVPFIVVALARQTFARREGVGTGLKKLGSMLGIAILVSGWHYVRLWKQTGRVVIGGWDPASGSAWWQDDGYRVAAWFGRFGESMLHPLFSCTASFLDGIYSTMWGDGLSGGALGLAFRPPWNYNLMVAGYFLAVLPTVLILVGAAASAVKLVREGGSDRFVLLGLTFVVWVGLVYLNLRVPYYGSVKSFYGLCALVPLCFFGAVGWEVLTRERKPLQFALGVIMLVWAMNSYAALWIRGNSAPTYIHLGAMLDSRGRAGAAASEFARAVEIDPANALARRLWASALNEVGRTDEAFQQAERAVELDPTNAAGHYILSVILVRRGQMKHAIGEAQLAVELGPEDLFAHQHWSELLIRLGRDDEIINAARNGLAVSPYDPSLHYTLGLALARKNDLTMATNQFAYALLFAPDWMEVHLNFGRALLLLGDAPNGMRHLQTAVRLMPDSPLALNELAWLLATSSDAALRNGLEAVQLAEHGCAVTSRRDPMLLATLAAAYAEAGRFSEAINAAQEALALARTTGDEATVVRTENLLGCFQSGRAFHQNLIPTP
jgi:tetratricopeptide (TPR) repeat protein